MRYQDYLLGHAHDHHEPPETPETNCRCENCGIWFHDEDGHSTDCGGCAQEPIDEVTQ